jgi:hypothetical protein
LARQQSKLASSPHDDYYDPTVSFTDNQKQLLLNCIKLINHGRYIQTAVESPSAYDAVAKTSPTMTSESSSYSLSQQQQQQTRNIPDINVRILAFFFKSFSKKTNFYFIYSVRFKSRAGRPRWTASTA